MVGRGEEIRLILRFGSFLGSGIRNPHSLQALKKTVDLLPECISPFPEDELINSFGINLYPHLASGILLSLVQSPAQAVVLWIFS